MSATSIQFIGLFVVMMNGSAGLHILLPHFPGTPYEGHVSVIQYNADQVSSSTWPGTAACSFDSSLQCAPIAVETVTFSGASDPTPPDIIGDISHLTCCCASMTDILPKYKDPDADDKVSAHFFVDHGVAEAIAASNGRIDTWVTMHTTDPAGITVTGNDGTSTFNIVFKAGAQFAILNSVPPTTGAPNHFLAYYLMGVGSSTCTAVPTDGPPCAASATACSSLTRSSKVTKAASSKKKTKRRSKQRILVPKILFIDADCANSHFP
jgi:hypothetical protein